jgi:hypothetical protein
MTRLARRKQQMLLLAVDDMAEAIISGRHLRETDDPHLMQIFGTAMAVAYARPFTQTRWGQVVRLGMAEYEPSDPLLAKLHQTIIDFRNKVYAHTDERSGRTAEITLQDGDPSRWQVRFERYLFPRSRLGEALTLFDLQRERFQREAVQIAGTRAGRTPSRAQT